MTDYYKVLSVDAKASDTEIEQAYEKAKALNNPKEHLDDSLIDELSITNQRVLLDQAYHILSDPDKRKTYDQISKQGEKVTAKALLTKIQAHYKKNKETIDPEEDLEKFKKTIKFIEEYQEGFMLVEMIKYYLSSAPIDKQVYDDLLHQQLGYAQFQNYPFIKRLFEVFPKTQQNKIKAQKKLKWIVGLSHLKEDDKRNPKHLSASQYEHMMEDLLDNDPFARGLWVTWLKPTAKGGN